MTKHWLCILNPASHRTMLMRMLRNLHGVYVDSGDWERAVRCADGISETRTAATQRHYAIAGCATSSWVIAAVHCRTCNVIRKCVRMRRTRGGDAQVLVGLSIGASKTN